MIGNGAFLMLKKQSQYTKGHNIFSNNLSDLLGYYECGTAPIAQWSKALPYTVAISRYSPMV